MAPVETRRKKFWSICLLVVSIGLFAAETHPKPHWMAVILLCVALVLLTYILWQLGDLGSQ